MRKIIVSCFVLVLITVFGGEAMAGFTDNGDGTITDNDTGLMWQNATAPSKYSWKDALAYCENLRLPGNDSGYTDWRLPNSNELLSIVDYGRSGPASNFPGSTENNNYWSSSPSVADPEKALYVDFNYGEFIYQLVKAEYYVRAVRGGQDFGSLAVTITPDAAVTAGAKWRRTGTSTWFESGTTERNILAGDYKVEFKNDISGWSAPANQSVTVANAETASSSGQYTEGSDPQPIPTLSEWGMIITFVLLAGAMILQWRRRPVF